MLNEILHTTVSTFKSVLPQQQAQLIGQEVGRVLQVDQGIALVDGLPGAQALEVLNFANGLYGMAFNLDAQQLGVVLLGESAGIVAGSTVSRSGRVVDVPVGEALLGRVINGLGQPLDEQGPLVCEQRWPIEREAPDILARAPVTRPLQTGIKVIDAAIPIGRGQRQLIVGDRQTGKTSIALDTLLNQHDQAMVCVYCAIGQRGDAVARVVDTLRAHPGWRRTIVVSSAAQDPPGLQFITPYAATSIAEYFMAQGRDVLIVYDDLSRHALAYRELSLLLRRSPGREAYPGDIFYIHARLLERATCLVAGGSLTALPIVEIEAENLAAYIPTNLISITDGQIYLSPDLFHKGYLPAVDVGKSVSRVGGRAQLPAYRAVSGALKLVHAQFIELEMFARFGTRLDDRTRGVLARGKRLREVLKQAEQQTQTAAEQIAVLIALTAGDFDVIELAEIAAAEQRLRAAIITQLPALCQRIAAGELLSEADKQAIRQLL